MSPLLTDDHRPSSTPNLEKVSQSKAKKNGGLWSYFRRRFSRKPKNSRLYKSAPSVLQYNDNIFMVERQTEQKVRYTRPIYHLRKENGK